MSRLITKRDNGGPPLNDDAPKVMLGQKFLKLFAPARHKVYYGGRGSGKSHAIATVLVILSAQKLLRVVCARQYQNSLKDSSKELIENKIKELGLLAQFTILEREIVNNLTGSRFTFIGLDRNPDSAKSLEGADICWVEEARTINQRSMEILIPTIRKPGSEIWWTYNPEHADDPVDAYFRGGGAHDFIPPPNSVIERVGIEDNPWFYQTAMPSDMWYMMQGNPVRYKHVWLGEYDESFETKIFTNVRVGRIDLSPELIPVYGMDYGYAHDPTAILKIYVNFATRQIYIAREVFGRFPERDLPQALEMVVERKGDIVIADSAQPILTDALNHRGFNVVSAIKGPGSIKSGINFLQGFEIVIDPDCEEMRNEARLYSWQVDKRTGMKMNVPVDAHNHGWDAVRYACERFMTNGDASGQSGVIKLRL